MSLTEPASPSGQSPSPPDEQINLDFRAVLEQAPPPTDPRTRTSVVALAAVARTQPGFKLLFALDLCARDLAFEDVLAGPFAIGNRVEAIRAALEWFMERDDFWALEASEQRAARSTRSAPATRTTTSDEGKQAERRGRRQASDSGV